MEDQKTEYDRNQGLDITFKACFGNLFLPAGPLKIVPELEHKN